VTTTTTFAYDDVPYDTEANADAHPSAIATLAHLAGLSESAPASRARVLEIGCGNGENLLAAATYLPHARFVGFDLAASAIAAGNLAAKESAIENVSLFAADIKDVLRAAAIETEETTTRAFDYVIAHGMYSWVPDPIREDLLAIMHDALAPHGLGFLSVNALPGWSLRRALRELALDATRSISTSTPAAKVAETLRLITELGGAMGRGTGFSSALATAAREYIAHVERATPLEAPFSRYVFHDLLAECNDPFSVDQLSERLTRAGLRIVCETPLRPSRGTTSSFESLSADMASTGTPFLQVIVQRDEERAKNETEARTDGGIHARNAIDLHLWADLTRIAADTYRTTTGAIVKPIGDDGLARAASHAPGFVRVRDLGGEDERIARQVFEGFCEGVFSLRAEPPPVVTIAPSDTPRVADHVRRRAAIAYEKSAPSAVITNALHRSFRVPREELAVVRMFDGKNRIAEIAKDREVDERFVTTIVDRYMRHLFLVPEKTTG
jgi:SAM-dependent methyltransferase